LRNENALSFLGFCLLFEVNTDCVAATTDPVTGEGRSDAPTVVIRASSDSTGEMPPSVVQTGEPGCDLLEVLDVKERSEEHSPRSGPEHPSTTGSP
jgi:hypothetical protein